MLNMNFSAAAALHDYNNENIASLTLSKAHHYKSNALKTLGKFLIPAQHSFGYEIDS